MREGNGKGEIADRHSGEHDGNYQEHGDGRDCDLGGSGWSSHVAVRKQRLAQTHSTTNQGEIIIECVSRKVRRTRPP